MIYEHSITLLNPQPAKDQQQHCKTAGYVPVHRRCRPGGVQSAGNVHTRHKRVAAAILVEADISFGIDLAEIWSAIVHQTVRTGRKIRIGQTFTSIVHASPILQQALPSQISEERRKNIAIAAAKADVEAEPELLCPLTDLGRTYRNAGQLKEAVQIFRANLENLSNKDDYSKNIRGYWCEWGVCEGKLSEKRENLLAAIWICGLALSDVLNPAPLNHENGKVILGSMGFACQSLVLNAKSIHFPPLLRAVAYLRRLTNPEPETEKFSDDFDRVADQVGAANLNNTDEAINWLADAVSQAGRELKDPFLIARFEPNQVSFNALRKLLTAAN